MRSGIIRRRSKAERARAPFGYSDSEPECRCRTGEIRKHAPLSPSAQNCLVFHMRQLQLTARRQPATRRVHGRPRHYTRMDSQTHIEIMREP